MSRGNIRFVITLGLIFCASGLYLTWHTVLARSDMKVAAISPDHAGGRRALGHAGGSGSKPIDAFRLRTLGGTFDNSNLLGRWNIVFFGYTHCPSACPTALGQLQRLMRQVRVAGQELPQVVFVSVDSNRDTPKLLNAFVHAFDSNFIGATADDEALKPLLNDLGAYYQRGEPLGDDGYYVVDHSTAIYLIDPQGRLRKVFAPPHDGAAMAKQYIAIVERRAESVAHSAPTRTDG